MDDIAASQILLHGCKLAGELEANLLTLLDPYHHEFLINACEQIVETFNKAIQQLRSSDHGFIGMENTFDLFPAGATIGQQETPLAPSEKQMGSPNTAESVEMIAPRVGPASAIQRGEEPSTEAAVMLIGSSGESSFGVPSMTSNKRTDKMKKGLTQKGSKRKNRDVKRTVRVPAKGVEQMGELPDDGNKWRKYGQKNFGGARFPRSYYRCTHARIGCGARKVVQRLDEEDPCTMEITYFGIHTCGSSFVVPCKSPPTNLEHNQQSQSQSISIQLGTWSSGEVQCSATNANVHSEGKTGKEAIVMYGSDSSDSSVHIRPQTKATKDKDETTLSQLE